MSGVGDDRWPNTRGQQSVPENQNPNQSRQSNQQRQTSRGAVVPPRAAGPDLTSMSGNAWANNDRANREAPQQGPAQEQHVPVNGFNAQDARNILKNGSSSPKAILEVVWLTCFAGFASEHKKFTSSKNTGQSQGTRSGSPWASKPNTMGNGKDFFLELRKQLTTLQQHGPERAGG